MDRDEDRLECCLTYSPVPSVDHSSDDNGEWFGESDWCCDKSLSSDELAGECDWCELRELALDTLFKAPFSRPNDPLFSKLLTCSEVLPFLTSATSSSWS